LILDSSDLEREKGITILAKTTSIRYRGIKINIIDTPGHADFGGEVERVLGMADGCLLLVDAAEGPMPQTRVVLRQAVALGLVPMGRIARGRIRPGQAVARCTQDGIGPRQRIVGVLTVEALQRIPTEEAAAGEIVYLTGLPEVAVGDTVADADQPEALPRLTVGEPTLRMQISVNQS